MADKTEAYKKAFVEGEAAVRRKPLYAPQNPYEEGSEDAEEHEKALGWDAGAISAGICEIYTNGVLHKCDRR